MRSKAFVCFGSDGQTDEMDDSELDKELALESTTEFFAHWGRGVSNSGGAVRDS